MASDRVKLIVEFNRDSFFGGAEEAKNYIRCMFNLAVPSADASVEIVPDPTRDLPHSRACGPYSHEHGTRCHHTCPTCGIDNTKGMERLGELIDKDRAEHPTVNVTPDPLMLEVHTDYKRDF